MAKKIETEETLARAIADDLNKGGFPTFFLGSDTTPTDLVDFVSTGCSLLDLAISNRPRGGIACGRVTELNGLEQSGKSLLSAHMMANVQKEGGVAVLLDTENSVNEEFFRAVGLDMGNMLYRQPDSVEEIFESIEKIIESVRKGVNKDKKVIIVVDSITAAPTKKEIEGGYDKAGYATDKAIIMSAALKKIVPMIGKNKIALVFTNQLRMKMNAPAFSDPYTTSGGMALQFYASTRIRLSVVGKIQNKDKEVIGVTVRAKVIKNRLGPPLRTVDFDIYFDRGVDDMTSWLKFLKTKEIVSTSGATYKFVDSHGTEHKFTSASWKTFIEGNSALSEEIYQKMCQTMITSYKSDGISTEGENAAEIVSGNGEE
jgi:recombination protein RecA